MTQTESNSKSSDAPQPEAAPDEPSAHEDEPAAEADEGDEIPQEPSLVAVGNPLNARGGVILGVASLLAFILMAFAPRFRWGVHAGIIAIAIATVGLLDLLGSFDDPDERVAHRTSLQKLAIPLAIFTTGLLGTCALVSLAVTGYLVPTPFVNRIFVPALLVRSSSVWIPVLFLTTVIGFYLLGERLGPYQHDEDGKPRPLVRRHGFWLVVLMTVLYLPMLGNHSLSDPWETHYGEVAREILARNDWISLWWAQEGWFWSKPILNFWIQAVAMAVFGVRYRSGEMLSAAVEGRTPWPEWAVRLPIFLLTVLCVYLVYKAISMIWNRRAGLLSAIVLVTMPQWFMIAHQTMTDMPFVATMAAAMALFLMGIHSDENEEVRVYEVDLGVIKPRLSVYHLVIGAAVACVLPQILYLLSRNVDIRLAPFDIKFHIDTFTAGSPGNCGLPGNDACRATAPVLRGLHPFLQALIWAQALGILLYINWGERRKQRIYFLAAWLFAALSTMAKGPAGLILLVACALVYIVVSKRFRDLLRIEILSGVLLVVCVAIPWYVAMYARHGQPFTDRLIFHDMFKRAFTHVHDTNEGDDVSFRYYVWQMGYAMFPWTGLSAASLFWWLKRREGESMDVIDDKAARQSDASVFLAVWCLFAFAGFSYMRTKFHHYILPAIPPAAMLTGVLLDNMMQAASGYPKRLANSADGKRWLIYFAGLALGTLAMTAGVMLLMPGVSWAGPINLLASHIVGAFLIPLGIGLMIVSIWVYKKRWQAVDNESEMLPGDQDNASPLNFDRVMMGAIAMGAALLIFLIGRDMAMPREGGHSQVRLLHLFTYNYKRTWPTSLDFSSTLWALTIVAAILTLLLFVPVIRRHLVIALAVFASLFAAWGLNDYLVRTAPHWGQRDTVLAYVHANQEVPGPLIAYQMNWKGENFYSGNHLPAFVSSGKKFQDYILDEKKKGTKTFYFMTEHTRTTSLSNELGSPRHVEKLTTPAINNKFGLVRVTFE